MFNFLSIWKFKTVSINLKKDIVFFPSNTVLWKKGGMNLIQLYFIEIQMSSYKTRISDHVKKKLLVKVNWIYSKTKELPLFVIQDLIATVTSQTKTDLKKKKKTEKGYEWKLTVNISMFLFSLTRKFYLGMIFSFKLAILPPWSVGKNKVKSL